MSKFCNVPVDKDTKILGEDQMKFLGYDILYQKWFWDGIYAESVIFHSSDVLDLSNEEIVELVNSSPIVKNKTNTTISRSDKNDFVFVNFNFQTN